jgi:hypothetical protein
MNNLKIIDTKFLQTELSTKTIYSDIDDSSEDAEYLEDYKYDINIKLN